MLCRCKCGNCRVILLANISECYCCSELEGCLESMKSDLVLDDLAGFLPGFNPICLQKWSLRLATAKFKTKGKQQYGQNGSGERLVIKWGNRPKASKNHCSTDVNKTKEVRKIVKSTASNLGVTLQNVQKLVDSIQDQFDSSSKVMSTLQGITNKHVKRYTCLFSDSNISGRVKWKPQKANLSSRKRNKKQLQERLEANKKHKKNLSNKELTNDEINLLVKRLKFIATPVNTHKATSLAWFWTIRKKNAIILHLHRDRNRNHCLKCHRIYCRPNDS